MISHRDIWAVLRHPRRFLTNPLQDPPTPTELFAQVVTPLAAIRSVAVLLRSLVGGTILPGVVLSLGSLALHVGAWLGLSLVLPTLARQFGVKISERQGFVLATYSAIPLWLAGVLYVVPEQQWVFFLWSRVLALAIAAAGLYVMDQGLAVLETRPRVRPPLLVAIGLTFLVVYIFLFAVLGTASHVVLFVLSTAD